MSAETNPGGAAAERFDALHAEAKEALARAANALRAVTEQYREAFHASLGGWHDERDALDRADRHGLAAADGDGGDGNGPADDLAPDLRSRVAVRTAELGERQTELARLELAVRGLERTWLFLERGDASLLADPAAPDLADDFQMRIVEAREAERTRLAQEVHDGPAQALSNAIFGVEYVEKILEVDRAGARMELRFLRERLRRELGEVRAFISQLRPPILDEVGLEGAMQDAADTIAALTDAAVEVDLAAPGRRSRGRRAGGGPANPPGGAPERPQARRGAPRPARDPRRRRLLDPRGPGRRAGVRPGGRQRPWATHVRAPVHARAGRARSRQVRGPLATRERHDGRARDPPRGRGGST